MEDRPVLTKLVREIQSGRSIDDLIQYTEDFERLMSYYWCAIREVETKFRVLDNQLSLGHRRNPIENIKSRLKSVRSIEGKLNRLGLPVTYESVWRNLNDVAGIRVICSYIDDIYMLADCFLSQDDVTLISRKDYIESPKPNGYRSLHLIVEVPIFLESEKRMVRVEVQLRTISMESWANLEHSMRYKKELSPELEARVSEILNGCAEMSHSLDLRMKEVRDMVEEGSASPAQKKS